MRSRLIVALALLALPAAAPAAADDDSQSHELRTYEVTLTNSAATQPISPPVLVTHDRDIRFWQTGVAASAGITAIAEDGNPAVAADMLDLHQ